MLKPGVKLVALLGREAHPTGDLGADVDPDSALTTDAKPGDGDTDTKLARATTETVVLEPERHFPHGVNPATIKGDLAKVIPTVNFVLDRSLDVAVAQVGGDETVMQGLTVASKINKAAFGTAAALRATVRHAFFMVLIAEAALRLLRGEAPTAGVAEVSSAIVALLQKAFADHGATLAAALDEKVASGRQKTATATAGWNTVS
jgi:hypothetical protein